MLFCSPQSSSVLVSGVGGVETSLTYTSSASILQYAYLFVTFQAGKLVEQNRSCKYQEK